MPVYVWRGRVIDSSGCTSPIVMSWVMLSRTCTRISVGERFFSIAISVVILLIVFYLVFLSLWLAMLLLLRYLGLVLLIRTIFTLGILVESHIFLVILV